MPDRGVVSLAGVGSEALARRGHGSPLGVAQGVGTVVVPINGLRHPPAGRTYGWYFWAGEALSRAPAFFEPRHVEHLGPGGQWLLPYLELAPGWRL